MARRYVLRLFMGANVVDGNDGRVVASASTVEHAIIDAFEWEVLAMRLKTEEPVFGMGGRVHIDVENVIEKKGLDSVPKVWAVVNALRKRGVNVVLNSEPTI
ncbi:hypothetical protein SESBI_35982 [Sesbania bispinosa]|nr:hypothetical protein SESBI_35982 [Sesbania bispinosa]